MRRRCVMLLAGLVMMPSAAGAQAPAPRASSRLGHGPDTVPDLTNRLIAVYGRRPLTDSAAAVLQRRGLRVADRSPGTIERARREKRRLEAAYFAVLVEMRYDSMARSPILMASLLDIQTTSRLRMTSVLYPTRGAWGPAMDTLLAQLLARSVRR